MVLTVVHRITFSRKEYLVQVEAISSDIQAARRVSDAIIRNFSAYDIIVSELEMKLQLFVDDTAKRFGLKKHSAAENI